MGPDLPHDAFLVQFLLQAAKSLVHGLAFSDFDFSDYQSKSRSLLLFGQLGPEAEVALKTAHAKESGWGCQWKPELPEAAIRAGKSLTGRGNP